MSDLMEISMLVARLGMAFDDQDLATLGECWAEDSRMSFTNAGGVSVEKAGREAILAWSESAWSRGPLQIRHFVSAVDIRLDGDAATVRYYTKIHGSEPVGPIAHTDGGDPGRLFE